VTERVKSQASFKESRIRCDYGNETLLKDTPEPAEESGLSTVEPHAYPVRIFEWDGFDRSIWVVSRK